MHLKAFSNISEFQRSQSKVSDQTIHEVVRRISQVNNPMTSNDGSANIIDSSGIRLSLASDKPTITETTREEQKPEASALPSGYEPENSLRRVSVATRPTQFKREQGVRRRSALDKPQYQPSIPEIPTTITQKEQTIYEPENSLRRVRKTSDQTKATLKPSRQRRAGVLPKTTVTRVEAEDKPGVNNVATLARASLATATLSNLNLQLISDSTPPPTPQLATRKLKTSLNLPLKKDLNSGQSPVSSPKQIRRISKGRLLSPFKLGSKANDVTPPASPRLLRHHSNSPTFNHKMKTSATAPVMFPVTPEEPRSTNGNKVSTKQALGYSSHKNAARYWPWYLLNASYSWKNFNTDSTYCY